MQSWEELLDKGVEARKQERLEPALSFFKRAFLATQEWAPGGVESALCRLRMGSVLLELDRLPEAVEELGTSIPVFLRLRGKDAPELLTARKYLAEALVRLERHAEALDVYEQLIEHEERCFGPNHPTVASTLLAQAECHLALREDLRAETLLRRSLAIRGLAHGSESAETLAPRIHLVALLIRAEKDDEAEAFGDVDPALVPAPASPVLVRSLRNIGHVLVHKGDLKRARPIIERVAELYQGILPVEHPLCVESLRDLGVLYLRLGDFARAEGPLSYGLLHTERRFGPMHPQVARLYNLLGQARVGNCKYDEALPLLQRSLEITAHIHGTDHPAYAEVLQSIGSLHFTQSNLRWAERFFRHALSALENSIGLARRRTLKVVMDLAGCLRLQGRAQEARRLFEQVVLRIRQHHGESHPLIPAYARAYVSLQQAPLAA